MSKLKTYRVNMLREMRIRMDLEAESPQAAAQYAEQLYHDGGNRHLVPEDNDNPTGFTVDEIDRTGEIVEGGSTVDLDPLCQPVEGCLACGSIETENLGLSYGSPYHVESRVRCNACHATWHEFYHFSHRHAVMDTPVSLNPGEQIEIQLNPKGW